MVGRAIFHTSPSRRTALKLAAAACASAATGRTVAFDGVDDTRGVRGSLAGIHPRLLATATDFADVSARIANDQVSASWFGTLQTLGTGLLTVAPPTFVSGNLLNISRTTVNRIYTLSMLAQLGGAQTYAERAWDEVEAIAGFPRWSPSDPPNLAGDYLPMAEMTHAVAIAYDWLFESWTATQRTTALDAIVEKGLQPAMSGYLNNAPSLTSINNVGTVCNSGFGLGALAIAQESPTIAADVLAESLSAILPGVEQLSPDGGYPEGGYWGYAIRYLVIYLAALESALGDDDELSDVPGLSETGDFAIHLTSPTGKFFNFYDSDATAQQPPELLWLSNRYSKPAYTWWGSQSSSTDSLFLPRYLLWYDPSKNLDPTASGLTLDRYFQNIELATFRSAWEDPNAVFVGFKAGDNSTNHADLDLGTFVIDAIGQRWASDLGGDSYGLSGYFNYGPNGQRWNYYRKRAEGQNTLVINPTAGPDQDPSASASITRHDSWASGAFAIADLTAAVPGAAVTSWERGLAMIDSRQQVIVQDEVVADDAVDAWWFMHTYAAVQVAPDGLSAELTLRGARLLARILAGPAGAVFTVAAAAPLASSPVPSGQSTNANVTKLAIELPAVTAFRLSVLFSPIDPIDGAGTPPSVSPLENWSDGMS
ncbi:hypothetical protein EXU48_19910 [Occultella glacieicola]|uniref:Heparinase II/III-like protein n=2 Tax=Occultella glacieicola TaxID=2518684 RepID=A0ABY2DZ70_9MICO|nr:hypothetical protein EXU48_19910 [Occultella glacieicola]